MKLFSSLRIRDVELKNRIVVSPMCEYSAVNGHPQPWHMVHLGSRAVGGAALVFTEATAVEERGRISSADTGIYLDGHVQSWKPIAKFLREQGAVPGMQLAHAGRKGSTTVPWQGGKALGANDGAWETVAPSAIRFDEGYDTPSALTLAEIESIVNAFAEAAKRALAAGFEILEIHSAHGYLLHEFLSPLSNQRTDQYGGSFQNRTRLTVQAAEAIRQVWPEGLPLFCRISATDWKEGGWDLPQSIELAKLLKKTGVDLIDVSSGGLIPNVKIPVGPGYQVPFAEAIRKDAEIATASVGMITDPEQAEAIVEKGQADLVLLAREMLRDPYWPRRAAQKLGATIEPPMQYQRAW
ncbi:MAG TPA: NADH:flavin oxidoreductase/NADH oxidase [Candidatus Acidoferrum sp.]|jgi:2,4-dienoyl-CoA reductase-like NADH-dependent reductase (Old Yellow Enzyme family)